MEPETPDTTHRNFPVAPLAVGATVIAIFLATLWLAPPKRASRRG